MNEKYCSVLDFLNTKIKKNLNVNPLCDTQNNYHSENSYNVSEEELVGVNSLPCVTRMVVQIEFCARSWYKRIKSKETSAYSVSMVIYHKGFYVYCKYTSAYYIPRIYCIL